MTWARISQDSISPAYCSRCKAPIIGVVRLEDEEPICRDCQRRQDEPQQPRDTVLRRTGCPPRYYSQEFRPPDPWPSDVTGKDSRLSLWSGDPWCVSLVGDVGTGKTMLATALLYRHREMRPEGRGMWIRSADLVREIYDSSDIMRFCGCRVLLIDDLFHGTSAASTFETIAEVISYRYDRDKATIITTNKGFSDIEEKSPPTADRLRTGWIMGMTGQSRRG